MFVQELDRPVYLVVAKRNFFDKELGLTKEQEAAVLKLQDRANELQMWLREVYLAGDRSHKVEAPSWLVDDADKEREQPDSAPASSKTLRLPPKQKASGSSTKQSS